MSRKSDILKDRERQSAIAAENRLRAKVRRAGEKR